MIEAIIRTYMLQTLGGIPVYNVVPKAVPKRYYVVEKTGGGMKNRVRTALITVQSYADSMAEAASMNEDAINVLIDNDVEEIASVRLNSDYNYSNPTTKQFRYQAVFDVVHY